MFSTNGGIDDRVLPSFGRGLLHRYRSVVDGPPTFAEELGRGTRQAFDNLVTVASALPMVVPGGQPSGAALLETRAAAGIAGSIGNVNPLRSPWQHLLHPNGEGGFKIWGIEF